MTMPARFEGFPGLMQGGYLAGVTAGPHLGPARVQIRRPVRPGDRLTVIETGDGSREAMLDGEVAMRAFSDPIRIGDPPAMDATQVEAALAEPLPWPKPFPACVGCGDNPDGLGSEIRPLGKRMVAGWTPDADLAIDGPTASGPIGHEAVWTVVDCFTSWALFSDPPGDRSGTYVTGNIALQLRHPLQSGVRYLMQSWKEADVPPGSKTDGRFKLGSIIVGGSIHDLDGQIVGLADQELVRTDGFGMDLATMGESAND